MRRLALAAAAAAVLPFAALHAQSDSIPRLAIGPCTVPGIEGPARCGTFTVWEDRSARSGRTVPLRFIVFPARSGAAEKDAIVSIPGGPGQGGAELAAPLASAVERLRDTRDVLLVDQRGTGASNLLRCDLHGSADSITGYLRAFYPADRVAACWREWEGKADVSLYTSDHAADDLDELRAALGYDRLNLIGGSYGTRAALVYMRRHPERVRTATLNGTVPVDILYPLTVARDAQRALDGVFAECAAEPACNAAFPELPGSLRTAMSRLASGPMEVEVMHPTTGGPLRIAFTRDLFSEAVRYLTYSPGSAALAPAMVHQAARGDYGPLAEYALFSRRNLVAQWSPGIFLSITCAEDLPFFTMEEAERAAEGTYLGVYRARDQKAACAAWPVRPMDRAGLTPVASDAPVLLVSGQWDPVTPPSNAERAMRTLRNARHVVFPSGAHSQYGLVGGGACQQRITEQFIRAADPRAVDVSCVDSVRRAPFPTRRLGGNPIALPEADLARFAGRYRAVEGGWTLEVAVDGGRLRQTLGDGRTFTLIPVERTRFRVIGAPLLEMAFVEEAGRVTGMRVEDGGNPPLALERAP